MARRHSEEFRREAVRIALTSGLSLYEGVGHAPLSRTRNASMRSLGNLHCSLIRLPVNCAIPPAVQLRADTGFTDIL